MTRSQGPLDGGRTKIINTVKIRNSLQKIFEKLNRLVRVKMEKWTNS
jgi:hypothetical protein